MRPRRSKRLEREDLLPEDWAEATAKARSEADEIHETGGERLVLFNTNTSDWDRIEADSERLLRPLAEEHKKVLRHEDRDLRLLNALSVVTGWAIDSMWDKLLTQLMLELERAAAIDESACLRGGRSGLVKRISESGICYSPMWISMLNGWWEADGRSGEWELQGVPEVSLAWDTLPDQALVGPCLVQWNGGSSGGVSKVSALVNGVLNDLDRAAYGADMYFFVVLKQ